MASGWKQELRQYVFQRRSAGKGFDEQLARAVLKNPASPAAWLAFIAKEESECAREASNEGTVPAAGASGLLEQPVSHLYRSARKAVPFGPNQGDAAYWDLHIGHARHKWRRDRVEARIQFKDLIYNSRGRYAPVFLEFAGLEAASGDAPKALATLAKGLGRNAAPRELLETAKSDMENGRYAYSPWISAAAAGVDWGGETSVSTQPRSGRRQQQSASLTCVDMPLVAGCDGPDTKHMGMSGPERSGQDSLMAKDMQQPSPYKLGSVEGDMLGSNDNTVENATTTATMLLSWATNRRKVQARRLSAFGGAQRVAKSWSEPNSGETGAEGQGVKRRLQGDDADSQYTGIDMRAKKPKVQEEGADAVKSGEDAQAGTNHTEFSAFQQPRMHVVNRSTGPIDSGVDSRVQRRFLPRLEAVEEQVAQEAGSYGIAGKDASGQSVQRAEDPVSQEVGSGEGQEKEASVGRVAHLGVTASGNDLRSRDVHTSCRDASRNGGNIDGSGGFSGSCTAAPVPVDGMNVQSSNDAKQLFRNKDNVRDQNASWTRVGNATCQRSTNVAAADEGKADSCRSKPDSKDVAVADKEPRRMPMAPMQTNASQANCCPQEDAGGQGPWTKPGSPKPSGSVQQPSKGQAPQPLEPVVLKSAGVVQLSIENTVEMGPVPEDGRVVYIKGRKYHKLELIGRGGFSKVYKVLDPQNHMIYALKRCSMDARDKETVRGILEEVELLRHLAREPQIVQLIDYQYYKQAGVVYMLQELGEIDLTGLLHNRGILRQAKGATEPDWNFIRSLLEQMAEAVVTIHGARIVHSDLKPANFLMVKGALKLIDFGIARKMEEQTTCIHREQQIGTLDYMAPETLLPGAKVGRPSDVWSLGCILYQMVYSKKPFQHISNVYTKVKAITDPKYEIEYPECGNEEVVRLMQRCLHYHAADRITLKEVLGHPFVKGR
ncbi:unnamed protein product [Ostreobium quekettii]|uniref:Protein kinase domain-containing protein n=1 Tax=Ostreobium quekettii TaxID=121088 RepID=A0A8S1JDA2_9CHLO|nr:unnamed protein product [Ostreobium quekettii]|eukprot:evm.model.scf_847EXC.5 EVM.evm.TU.scf_847EXC.5   scf_847EXC:29951-32782(-)